MRLDRFTEKAQEALQSAAQEAQERGQQAIETEHLVLALIHQQDGISRPLLEAAGASIPGLEAGDHLDDILRGAGINPDLELVEDFLGAAGDLDIVAFEGGSEVGLGNVAGFP